MNKEMEEKMDGLTNKKALDDFAGAAKYITLKHMEEGFDATDTLNYLNDILSQNVYVTMILSNISKTMNKISKENESKQQ